MAEEVRVVVKGFFTMQIGTNHAPPPTLRDNAASQHTALAALLRANSNSLQQQESTKPPGSSGTIDAAVRRGGALSVVA